ncbi:MAG: glycosyltransferase [Bacteroidales bacterium]|nr:glycosyltransferase [Bacteroidales bacterium]
MFDIFYITESDFTKEVASTHRVYYNALSISAISNTNLTIIGYGDKSHTIREEFVIKNVYKGKNYFQKIVNFIFRGLFIINMLRKESTQPDIIIYYGTHTRILFPLLKYCHRKRIKLITDVSEWSDYSHLLMGRFGLIALDIHLAMTKLISKCDGVIAISSFLENYYRKQGKITLRIPVTVDTSVGKVVSRSNSQFDSKYLNLIYAGIPGKKDLLYNVIEAIQQLYEENYAVKLHLLGLNFSTIKKKYPHLNNEAFICYGRVPHNQVRLYLQYADFSVLLRPGKRYSMAGFPTKFVESMNSGLPVIANLTSDLFMYLKNGFNGFVVDNSSPEALKSLLKKITKMQRSQFEIMRQNALETAKLNFDYRIFTKDLNDFFNKIMCHKHSDKDKP